MKGRKVGVGHKGMGRGGFKGDRDFTGPPTNMAQTRVFTFPNAEIFFLLSSHNMCVI
jgi:hypothetical protein